MQALLIGIDPPKEVKNEIYRLKKRVIDTSCYQQQANEHPHCTFVVNNFTSVDEVDEALKEVAGAFSPFDIDVNGVAYFPPEQSGTYMTYAKVTKSKKLEDLQRRVVVDTSRFRQGCLLQEYLKRNVPGYKYKPGELDNIKKYGFLYVGENWSPHISVAILDPEAFEKVGEELIRTDLRYAFPLKAVTLFTYKDKWQPFRTYKLGD